MIPLKTDYDWERGVCILSSQASNHCKFPSSTLKRMSFTVLIKMNENGIIYCSLYSSFSRWTFWAVLSPSLFCVLAGGKSADGTADQTPLWTPAAVITWCRHKKIVTHTHTHFELATIKVPFCTKASCVLFSFVFRRSWVWIAKVQHRAQVPSFTAPQCPWPQRALSLSLSLSLFFSFSVPPPLAASWSTFKGKGRPCKFFCLNPGCLE